MGQIDFDNIRYTIYDSQFNDGSCNFNDQAVLENLISASFDNTIHEEDEGTEISKDDMDS